MRLSFTRLPGYTFESELLGTLSPWGKCEFMDPGYLGSRCRLHDVDLSSSPDLIRYQS